MIILAAGPNLAWAPVKLNSPPQQGVAAPAPSLRRVMDIKQLVMPLKGSDVFVAPSANILGDVKIGTRSSIWYGATLRGKAFLDVCQIMEEPDSDPSCFPHQGTSAVSKLGMGPTFKIMQ